MLQEPTKNKWKVAPLTHTPVSAPEALIDSEENNYWEIKVLCFFLRSLLCKYSCQLDFIWMIVVSSFFRCKINNKMTHLSIIYQTFVLQVSMRFGCGVVALLIMKGSDFTPLPSSSLSPYAPWRNIIWRKITLYSSILCHLIPTNALLPPPFFVRPWCLHYLTPGHCSQLIMFILHTYLLIPPSSLYPSPLKCYRERKEGA